MYIPRPTNMIKSKGIMTLFAFSIPPAIPSAIITAVTTIAIISHILLPNELAVLPNIPPIADISLPIAALLAAFVIIPGMAAGGAELSSGGPGLMFIYLVNVFNGMPGGKIVGIVFYVCVLFAFLSQFFSG